MSRQTEPPCGLLRLQIMRRTVGATIGVSSKSDKIEGEPVTFLEYGATHVAIDIDVFPRQGLTPREFKSLGRSVRRWLDHHQKYNGGIRWYDDEAIDSLLKGEPPRSLGSAINAGGVPAASSANDVGESGIATSTATALATAPSAAATLHEPAVSPGMTSPAARAAASWPSDWVVRLSLVYTSPQRKAIIADARRALPEPLVAGVLVDGRSWEEI